MDELGVGSLPHSTLVILEGNICAGKSTIAEALMRTPVNDKGMAVRYFKEDVVDEDIDKYKNDLKKVVPGSASSGKRAEGMRAMAMQEDIAVARERTIRRAIDVTWTGETVILERGEVGNLVFAANACRQFGLPDVELMKSTMRVMQRIHSRPRPPVNMCTIFLEVSPEEAFARNQVRDASNPYTLRYLTEVGELYDELMDESDSVIRCNAGDSDELDLMARLLCDVVGRVVYGGEDEEGSGRERSVSV